MPMKSSLSTRAAVVALLAALSGGSAAVAVSAIGDQSVPDLSMASLADLHANTSPALAAVINRICASSEERPLQCGFNN
jgi:hypothetical protein